MEAIVLGSGTSLGIPIIGCSCEACTSTNPKDKRLRSSIFIKSDNTNFIIDVGPDFRQQMLRENIKKIDAVLITHEHRDHIGGLDDIRPFNYLSNAAMPIYAEQRVCDAIINEFSYSFNDNDYPGIPKFNINAISEEKFTIKDIEIQPIRLMHANLPILGFKIKDFVYITDASFISDTEIKKIKNSKILIINALRHKKHNSHFSLNEAIKIAQKTNAEQVFLTHISCSMGLHNKINSELPENIKLAYDGLRIVF
ncbi:MAG: MBL fold metallo-hydrolase [Bacteroidales bacterium]|jgi:phosphoribosyl 1,2-cyclic phosphate phosphodiesterase|nr:MBL fold metallo-hydrolase [Bacteroidales bacterium]MCK9498734.1 MBL fold metallo-hydrolase [Bacteroidales bacterium]MDY0313793.1 MBL fold metallo-hydrolase [Bacteroidales bacterium]